MAINLNMSVLIVDDCKTMLKIDKSLLTQIGFTNIDEASNGAMAIGKLQEKQYQLVVSDWNMEPMTGLDLVKNIRANEATKNIKFLMVTAESKTENVIAAKNAGADNYIVKPFNVETLKAKLTAILGEF